MVEITPIESARTDNIFYLVRAQGRAALVDPIDPDRAAFALERSGCALDAIWITHWHPDHAGALSEVRARFGPIPIWGPGAEAELIERVGRVALDRALAAGDRVELGQSAFSILALPGHTVGHIAYRAPGHLLLGDVVFAGGCGHARLGGDLAAMSRTFRGPLAALSDSDRLYFGHDYAAENAAFGLSIAPGDEAIEALARRAEGAAEPILTTLGEERAHNVMMRLSEPAIQHAARAEQPRAWADGEGEEDACFRALRAARDAW